ncbi:hypothetical protein LIA77_11500 [Sarocladium implicatum]|nr:hypothetical protein LIA77_11500 [Sarocladium implicatum]
MPKERLCTRRRHDPLAAGSWICGDMLNTQRRTWTLANPLMLVTRMPSRPSRVGFVSVSAALSMPFLPMTTRRNLPGFIDFAARGHMKPVRPLIPYTRTSPVSRPAYTGSWSWHLIRISVTG